jgi:hypothetical protein
MATLKDQIILAGVVCAVAYVAFASQAKEKTVRASLMSTNGLTAAEAPALEGCLEAVQRKALVAGGSVQSFCGCFVKRATTVLNDGHKQLVVQSLKDMMAKSQPVGTLYTPASFAGRASSAASVVEHVDASILQCASMQQTSFKSEQQNRAWCSAHADGLPKDDPRCRNLDSRYRTR